MASTSRAGRRRRVAKRFGAFELTSGLATGVVSVTRTKRRRFLYCAWWSGEPSADPFRPPDAWAGGARSEAEARAEAEKVAGRPLRSIEGRWASAWLRVHAGQAPFPASSSSPRAPSEAKPPRPIDPHALLGVATTATLAELKAAFRRRALELHPDHGGDALAFIAAKRAYDTLAQRRRR